MGCRTQINSLQLTNDLSIFQSLNLYKIQKTVLIKKGDKQIDSFITFY